MLCLEALEERALLSQGPNLLIADPAPQDGPGTQNIHGPDDRVRVTTTQDTPYRMVGRLRMRFPTGESHCSGSMVSAFHFLTAGHCVFSSGEGGRATVLGVSLGQDRAIRPYGEALASEVHIPTEWLVGEDPNHDWALVALDRRLGTTTGWFSTTTYPTAWFSGGQLNSAGYPGDRGNGIEMYRIAGPSSHATGDSTSTAGRVFYAGTMDTAGGQSGSGVWDNSRNLVAVHAYGAADYNSGTRLNQAKIDRINSLIAADQTARLPVDRADLIDHDVVFQTSLATVSPNTVQPGQNLYTRIHVRNQGTAASGNFNVTVYALPTPDFNDPGRQIVGTTTSSSLTPFTSADVIRNAALPAIPAGRYYIGFVIDSGGQVTEFEEGNNGRILPYTINILPVPPTGQALSTSSIRLTWGAYRDAVRYEVERSWQGVGGYVRVGTPTTPTFTDTNLEYDTRYVYHVRAVYANGSTSNWSPIAAIFTLNVFRFDVALPTAVTAGTLFTFTVTARDQHGNIADGFHGFRAEVSFRSTDGQAQLPGRYIYTTDDRGVHSFTAALRTAGTRGITAEIDFGEASGTGTTLVNHAAATRLVLTAPNSAVAGSPLSTTVEVRDDFGNRATSFTGTVSWTSSDVQAALPAPYAFTVGDAGRHTFVNETLLLTNTYAPFGQPTRLTAHWAAITTDSFLHVDPAALAYLILVPVEGAVMAGVPFDLYVLAFDVFFNLVHNYTGTVEFATSDPLGEVPPTFTFRGHNDFGIGFLPMAAALHTPGPQVLSVRDAATRTIVWHSYLDVLPPFRSGRHSEPRGLDLPEDPVAAIVAALVLPASRNPVDDAFGNLDAEGLRGY